MPGDAVGGIIAVEALISGAGEDVDDAVGGHHADGVIAGDGDVDLARGIHRQPRRQMQVRIGGEPGVAPEARGVDVAVAGERGDDAVGVHLADAVIQRIGDVEVARGIERDALRRIQLRVDRGTAVAGETGARIARHQGQRAGAIDLEDRIAAAEIDIAAGDRELPRLADRRVQGRYRGSGRSPSGDGGNRVLLRERSACQQQDRESQHASSKSR